MKLIGKNAKVKIGDRGINFDSFCIGKLDLDIEPVMPLVEKHHCDIEIGNGIARQFVSIVIKKRETWADYVKSSGSISFTGSF